MGKKKTTPKHEKKPQIHNLNKIVRRPKVFITHSSNFKNLVQELTGNGNSPVSSPALPPFNQDQENSSSSESSCLQYPDLSSQFMDLESLLMGIDSYGVNMMQQEVCLYDFDISSFM